MSDSDRPNHFYDDSLGDPAACTGDHNHPEPEGEADRPSLPPEVVESAKKAECSRCKVKIVGSRGSVGTVFLNTYVPGLGFRERLFLCGACGLAAREFLHPELESDVVFQAVKSELLARFL